VRGVAGGVLLDHHLKEIGVSQQHIDTRYTLRLHVLEKV
jgi:hypothetical protein